MISLKGAQAAAVTGYATSYPFSALANAAQNAVVLDGSNVLAVHCHSRTGGEFIDVRIFALGLRLASLSRRSLSGRLTAQPPSDMASKCCSKDAM